MSALSKDIDVDVSDSDGHQIRIDSRAVQIQHQLLFTSQDVLDVEQADFVERFCARVDEAGNAHADQEYHDDDYHAAGTSTCPP